MAITLDEAIKHCYEVADRKCDDCGKEHLQLAQWLEELRQLKTADVVEVVRCEDCKHKVDYCGRLMCGRLKYEFNGGVGGLVATVPEHFCSYGVRKEEKQ